MLTHLDREHTVAALYRATVTPRIVEVPELTFLMIDGHGDPSTSAEYQDAIRTLFTLTYSAKFANRRAGVAPARVAPLESLWWADDIGAFEAGDRASWRWTAMIRQPDDVTADLVERVTQEARAKKRLGVTPAGRLESFREGRSGQILHVGPYTSEGPTIRRLHEFIAEQGGRFDPIAQKHHEIYLGDPRRAAPERLRTIIRQPIAAT
jgi:hypothetical protein